MLVVNLVHQDSGENLSTVQLDVSKFANNEQFSIAQVKNI